MDNKTDNRLRILKERFNELDKPRSPEEQKEFIEIQKELNNIDKSVNKRL